MSGCMLANDGDAMTMTILATTEAAAANARTLVDDDEVMTIKPSWSKKMPKRSKQWASIERFE